MIKFLLINLNVTLLTLLGALHFSSFSQLNLLQNSGFEEFDTCPYSSDIGGIGCDQICKAFPWFQPFQPNNNWSSGCGGSSSDFFHSCSGRIPNILYTDYQFPHKGYGFSG
ncbi:MAG: hypothetical protein EBS86_06900, partial [Crocinitomicaceae bacterium]|nr:hypothetical protein [Crocinitomicaceae bacterium]